jgi:hypothetical protein
MTSSVHPSLQVTQSGVNVGGSVRDSKIVVNQDVSGQGSSVVNQSACFGSAGTKATESKSTGGKDIFVRQDGIKVEGNVN